jgi:hypothetical protein
MPDTIMNIFDGDAFSHVSMTAAANRIVRVPKMLGRLNLFEVDRITTPDVAISMAKGRLNLIPTTERGAPLPSATPDKQQLRIVRTPRVAKQSTLYAHEIGNLRAYEDAVYDVQNRPTRIAVSELDQVANIILARQIKLQADLEFTMEYHRLGAVQGKLLDSDGSRVIYDWFAELGVAQPAEIDFDLDNASPAKGALRQKCIALTQAVRKALDGLWIDGYSYLLALTGDAFWGAFTSHVEVDPTYGVFVKSVDQMNALQNWGLPGQSFPFAGIRWDNYAGSTDNKVAVGTDKVIFIPVNVPGLYRLALAPSEFFPYINTPGKDFYSLLVRDLERNAWVKPEIYSYPLHYCTAPEALNRGRMT